jgi:hypothetical protein
MESLGKKRDHCLQGPALFGAVAGAIAYQGALAAGFSVFFATVTAAIVSPARVDGVSRRKTEQELSRA